MEKIKSAYEIAMERADRMAEEASIDEDRLEKKDEAKSLLADFFREIIDAEQLWQKLQGKDEVLLEEVQLLLIDSLGLRSPAEGFKKIREGILAAENQKEVPNSSGLEQGLTQLQNLMEQYTSGRKGLEEQLQEAARGDSQMRQARGQDGRAMMKRGAALGEETRKRFSQAFSELEERAGQTFTMLQEELRGLVRG